jgi:hypothetical protein
MFHRRKRTTEMTPGAVTKLPVESAVVGDQNFRCLDDWATPSLDTVTLPPAPSDTITNCLTNVYIL